jgi:hypothetical protein
MHDGCVSPLSVIAPLLAQAGPIAQEDGTLFLGEDFWPWMILAFGAAMVVGNVLALVRPPGGEGPPESGSERVDRPPLARSVVLIVVGLAAAAWGLASLLA